MESKKRKAIQTAKFYFFDPGITHLLAGVETLDRNSNLWGQAFEQFILMELKAYISYCQKRKEIGFWRSTDNYEVDFIIGNETAIEVKSTKKVNDKHLKGLKVLQEEKIIKKFYLISEDPISKLTQVM